MAVKMPRLVRKFLQRLPIQWKVIIEPGEGDMLTIKSEFIDLKKKRGQHTIFAPTSYLANPPYYKVDWAHELCHAVLAEKLDLILGCSPVVGDIDPKEFQRRLEILFYARLHDDLLVNDARDELLGHSLTVEDVHSTYHSFLIMVRFDQISQDSRIPWMIALNIAEDERHHCQVGARKILDFFNPPSRQKIEKILAVYRSLPRLSWNPVVDLRALELSTQQIVAKIFQENWKPRMVNHPDFPARKVWSVE